MIVVHCFHQLEAAADWRDAIDALNLASDRPDPFSTYAFYAHVLRQPALFPPGARLWLLLACDESGVLRGCLPLRLREQRVLGRRSQRLDLLTAEVSDRPRLLLRSGDEQPVSTAMFDYLLSRRREWTLLEFQQQDADSALRPPSSVLRHCRQRYWPNAANGNISIRWPSLAGYYAALSKKLRSNLSRQMRQLLAAGEVELLASSDPDTLPALFALYCSVESHSWKARTDAGFDHATQLGRHYHGLIAGDPPMALGIQLLLLDGLPIAGLICAGFGSHCYALHIVYDERLARLAPGSAILFLGVRAAISGGYRCFSLMWGYGYYKARWLAAMSDTRSVQFYRPFGSHDLRRRLGDLGRRWRPGAATAALSNPARDSLDRPGATLPDQAWAEYADPARQERHAALVRTVRAGRGEFLDATQLAALMPFETRLPPPPHPATRGAQPSAHVGHADGSGVIAWPAAAGIDSGN